MFSCEYCIIRPGQITHPIPIVRSWACKMHPNAPETHPIFWACKFCHEKLKKSLDLEIYSQVGKTIKMYTSALVSMW